jgi:hypothetical protein
LTISHESIRHPLKTLSLYLLKQIKVTATSLSSNLPIIRPHLLWEYNLDSFDYFKSADIVIERVIERGNLEEWRQILNFYGIEKVRAVAQASQQLSTKDKQFTEIYVYSELNAP